jgi:WD40 repeat protein
VKLGDYEVEGELGRGGMGVVLRARTPDGRNVAIKVLSSTGARAAVDRFQRERRLLGSLGEEQGFVPLLDAGDSPRGPFLVMPFVSGGTLRDRMERGPLPLPDVVSIGRALATAMGKAHALGIVHRDLKPENVLFTAEGAPLVADLGLAKHWRDDAPGASKSVSLSKTGETRGTVGYMAPEQMNDAKTVGPPADVFALGAILYECLTGRAAFVGETLVETMAHAATGSYEPIRTLRPDASASLVRAIDRALAVAADARFADGAALARALEGGGDEPRSRRLPVAIAASVLVAGAATAFALRGSKEAPAAPAPAPAPAPARPAARAEPSFPEECRAFRETPLARLVSVCGDYAWSVKDGCYCIVRSPDGKQALGGEYDGTAALVDLSTGRELLALQGHGGGVSSVAFSRDGRIAFAATGVIEAWDLATGRPLEALAGRGQGATAIVAAPDPGHVLVGKNDGSVEIWDIRAGTSEATRGAFAVDRNPITTIDCSRSGETIIAGNEAGRMELLSLAGTRLEGRGELSGHSARVNRVELAPDEKTALSCSEDGAIIRWDLSKWGQVPQRIDRAHDGEGVKWVAHSPDGGRAASAAVGGRAIKTWRLGASSSELRSLHPLTAPTAVVFARDGRLISTGWDRHLHVWDVERGRDVSMSPDAHGDTLRSVAFSHDGARIVTASGDGIVHVWDLATGRSSARLDVKHGGFASSAVFLPGGKQVLVGGFDAVLRIWDPVAGSVREIPTGGGPLQATALSPDGKRAVTASEDGTAKLWDLASGKSETIASIPRDWMQTAAFSPDGRFVAVGASSQQSVLHVGEVGQGTLRAFGGPMNQVTCVAFTPSGQRLYSSSEDGLVRVWEVRTGEQVGQLAGHAGAVKAVAVSPEGGLVVTAGKADGTIRIWSARTGRELGQIPLATSADYPNCLAFAPDGRSFAAGTSRGLVLRFELTKRDER